MKKTLSSAFSLLIAVAMTLIILEAVTLMDYWKIIAIKSPSVSDIACAPDSRYSYTKKGSASTKNMTEIWEFRLGADEQQETRNLYSAWMKSREDVYEERRKRVESVCAKLLGYERYSQEFPGRNIMFDLKNKLAYCQNAKVKMSRKSPSMLCLCVS